MKSYNDYINLLKKEEQRPNYDQLLERIYDKAKQKSILNSFAIKFIPVVLTILVVGLFVFSKVNFPFQQSPSYVDYVFTSSYQSDDPILSYVFSE